MKRIVMLLAVAFVLLGVGVAFAEEMATMGGGYPPTPPGCPELPKSDTLKINWSVVPKTTIDITEDNLNICVYIGCKQWESSKKTFNYKAEATGMGLRKIVGSLGSALPNDVQLKLDLKRPDSIGTSTGMQTLSTSNVDLVKNLQKLCLSNGTGDVYLSAGPNAEKGNGMVILQLTIMDQA